MNRFYSRVCFPSGKLLNILVSMKNTSAGIFCRDRFYVQVHQHGKLYRMESDVMDCYITKLIYAVSL